MDVKTCSELIEGSKIMAQQRGGAKGPAEEEQVTIDFAFATICSIQPINEGDTFSRENIWVKRPGKGGILAEQYEQVLGKRALRNVPADVQVTWEDIG
jgi:N-acetylneuraminate synthase